jgi:hypothetical protein
MLECVPSIELYRRSRSSTRLPSGWLRPVSRPSIELLGFGILLILVGDAHFSNHKLQPRLFIHCFKLFVLLHNDLYSRFFWIQLTHEADVEQIVRISLHVICHTGLFKPLKGTILIFVKQVFDVHEAFKGSDCQKRLVVFDKLFQQCKASTRYSFKIYSSHCLMVFSKFASFFMASSTFLLDICPLHCGLTFLELCLKCILTYFIACHRR